MTIEKQKMIALLADLLAVLEKHEADLGYTTADDGVHAYLGNTPSPGFLDRDNLRAVLRDFSNRNQP